MCTDFYLNEMNLIPFHNKTKTKQTHFQGHPDLRLNLSAIRHQLGFSNIFAGDKLQPEWPYLTWIWVRAESSHLWRFQLHIHHCISNRSIYANLTGVWVFTISLLHSKWLQRTNPSFAPRLGIFRSLFLPPPLHSGPVRVYDSDYL